MTKVAKGFILKTQVYKEHDGLVAIFLEDGSLRQFLFRGLYKPQSKRLGQTQMFQQIEVTYKDRESLLTPIDIITLNTYSNVQEDMNKSLIAQSINAIFVHFSQHLNYSLYKWSIEILENSDNINLVFTLTLVEILNLMGFQPYVDGDVKTHETKINHFDIQAGGFTYRSLKPVFSKAQLQLIRKLFKARPQNYSIIKDAMIDNRILQTIVDYFEYHTSFQIKGFKIYQSLQ